MAEENNEREATELGEQDWSTHVERSAQEPDEATIDFRERPQPSQKHPHMVKKFWTRQIAVTVDHDGCRDHFGRSNVYRSIVLPCYRARSWTVLKSEPHIILFRL